MCVSTVSACKHRLQYRTWGSLDIYPYPYSRGDFFKFSGCSGDKEMVLFLILCVLPHKALLCMITCILSSHPSRSSNLVCRQVSSYRLKYRTITTFSFFFAVLEGWLIYDYETECSFVYLILLRSVYINQSICV